jgi:hypothetical protein
MFKNQKIKANNQYNETISKPNILKITPIFKSPQQSTSKNTFNVNYLEIPINTVNMKKHYATTVANSLIPKKDQAITIDTNESLPHKDYIITIGKLVQPPNILFSSYISKGRVYIY